MRDMELLSVASRTKYPIDAFLFVQRGLDYTVTRLHGRRSPADVLAESETDESRHISGRQLCHGLRDYAMEQYGLLAKAVLQRWRITRCEDFGQIVFAMVQGKIMRKTERDSIDDFNNVFEFSEAFSPAAILTDRV